MLDRVLESAWLDERLGWIESIPAWLRPALYGPLLLAFLIFIKGGIFLIPLAAMLLLLNFERGLSQIAYAASIGGIVFAAAAIGGLLHGVFGRHIRQLPLVGKSLAGIIAVAPYVGALIVVLRLEQDMPLLAPWTSEDLIAWSIATVVAGTLVGQITFGHLELPRN